ncbi:MAG: penicillin-binding protein 2 [Lachnospiraceae bacterium]|nr:penicillin-binding protein 2 [Lachnospiraceae bacterium]
MKKNKEEKKKRKRRFNLQIFVVTCFFIALFAAMSVYIVNYSVTHKIELISNSYNTRAKVLAKKNIRGSIYANDGQVLVSSYVDGSGTEIRDYKFGKLFSHVVGYSINGRMGIEDRYNYYLINTNAPVSVKAEKDQKNEKYPADDVYTTLDVNLQKVASDALGVYRGAVIVTEPSTGKVLAMVSKPDFDPALIAENWNSYLEDTETGVLVNRATQGLYPAGSTFKILTSIEYIKENPENYNSYRYNCTGSFSKGDERIQCYHGSVHGSLDFTTSFAKSCNSSFANIGMNLNKNKFGQTLDQMLFNSELPTEDFDCAVSRLNVNDETPDADMIQIAIGQGPVGISVMHLNMVTCAIANDGILMKPYVVEKIANCEGKSIKSYKSEKYGSIMGVDEAKVLREMMEAVVKEGTGKRLKNDNYYACGKTGSAEYGSVKGESHAWFTGYAGLYDGKEKCEPDICITIIVEGAGAGGEYAVPIAKRIFDAYYGITIEPE